ncbi:hypothetical protein KQH82_04070 [bacterium]|nr:hypothetical protein [bacterium]
MISLLEFGILDLLGIALVSVLLYGVYSMVSKTRADRILAGLGAVGVLNLAARHLDLNLTVTILRASFAVIIAALIVICQHKTRRLFERFGDQRWVSRRRYLGAGGVSSVERRI